MTQTDDRTTQDWTGRTVHGRDGAGLGRIVDVFGRPGEPGSWAAVRRMGRRRLVPLDAASDDGSTVRLPIDRRALRGAPRAGAGEPDGPTLAALHDHYHGRQVLADAQTRRHERYGGTKLGAAFFGWLVAIGLTVLLGGMVSAVVAGFGTPTAPNPLATAVIVVAVLAVAYYAGGYVAGRLARFDGVRNGLFTWVIGVLVTLVAAVATATGGARFNLLADVRLPVTDLLSPTGVLTFVAVVVVTLAAALLGGAAGERYHHKVDRAGER